MKKLITGLVLGAICCTLFGTPAFPLKYDPRYHTETTNINDAHSSGDDSGWEEPITSSGPGIITDTNRPRAWKLIISIPNFGIFWRILIFERIGEAEVVDQTTATQNSMVGR